MLFIPLRKRLYRHLYHKFILYFRCEGLNMIKRYLLLFGSYKYYLLDQELLLLPIDLKSSNLSRGHYVLIINQRP